MWPETCPDLIINLFNNLALTVGTHKINLVKTVTS
jgi:hypothetical protein